MTAEGELNRLPNVVVVELQPGENVRGFDASGGGYGDPLEREPERVLKDVLEGWETEQRALDLYGVVLMGRVDDETLAVDGDATETARANLRSRQAEVSAA